MIQKRICIFVVFILLQFNIASNVFSKGPIYPKVQTFEIGNQINKSDWPQGMALDGKQIYVMDGAVIKSIKKNEATVYYDLHNLKQLLKGNGLDNDASIKTFRMAQMQVHKHELYVSGLLFKNTEDEGKTYLGDPVRGHTYNLIFKIDQGQARILHLSEANINLGFQPGTFFETQSGLPEDLYRIGNQTVYDYSKYITFPHFSFNDDKLIYVREQPSDSQRNTGPLHQVAAYENGVERVLYQWFGSFISKSDFPASFHYIMPALEDDTLTIYGGKNQAHYINLTTNEIQVLVANQFRELQRPLIKDGNAYFLDNESFFTAQKVWTAGKDYFSFRHYYADGFEFSGNMNIAGYDFDGNNLYILDFDRRQIHEFNLTGINDTESQNTSLESSATESSIIKKENDTSPNTSKNGLKVKIDGKTVVFPDAQPYVDKDSGRVMVPLRFVSEALKATVKWDDESQSINLAKSPNEGYSIFLSIGSRAVTIDKETSIIDAPPVIIDGRTFVPLRSVSEMLGAEVKWDSESQTAEITAIKNTVSKAITD
ncbi:copper amine oxidase N-terminal domain-containing protein [Paenibacillus frigoriresistens]|uniref:copper amine oxidase N-terminal domain-containing protein n=1 Tax=Paenibacillus alginolyticus TaxID=59839 RepID=UPI0015672F5F|nr:copper amine oxidase N-terminal domain-containing protein [Paenibacillus frigoriresistens]NRF93423.1 copper amine oxidase N-terminal domain-containing protein [Paenibacillus frigoriresistens]